MDAKINLMTINSILCVQIIFNCKTFTFQIQAISTRKSILYTLESSKMIFAAPSTLPDWASCLQSVSPGQRRLDTSWAGQPAHSPPLAAGQSAAAVAGRLPAAALKAVAGLASGDNNSACSVQPRPNWICSRTSVVCVFSIHVSLDIFSSLCTSICLYFQWAQWCESFDPW